MHEQKKNTPGPTPTALKAKYSESASMTPDKGQQNDATFSSAEKLDDLSRRQKDEVEEQSRPTAALIHETIRADGESELGRSVGGLALSGLAAGLSMGFSLVVQGVLSATLPAGPASQLISPFGYTVGFLIVILGRQQLFTENTLTPVLPLLHHRDLATLRKVMRLWVVVLLGNTAGAVAFALLLSHTAAFEPNVTAAFTRLAQETIQASFSVTLVKAVFAGWLVALLVWLLPSAETARTSVIIIVTYVIAVARFSHIVAGTADCSFLVLTGAGTWTEFWTRFYVPTLLGNIIGGVTLVAALNYGQVARELK